MKYKRLHITMSLTDRCKGRNCSFCGTNAKSKGEDLSRKNEKLFYEQLDAFPDKFTACITGGGESLLARNLWRMTYNLFTFKNFGGLSWITSGATPDDTKEWKRFVRVLEGPYGKYINPNLSYHLSGSGFDKRFIESFKHILLNTQVKTISIKLIHGRNIGQTYAGMYDNVLNVLDSIRDQKEYIIRPVGLDYQDEFLLKFIRSKWLQEKINDFSLKNMQEIAVAIHCFECRFLFYRQDNENESVVVEICPQKISGSFGRGIGNPNAITGNSPCSIFFEKHPWNNGVAKISLQSDGYYYPTAYCPKGAITHLGNVGEETLREKIKRNEKFLILMKSKMSSRREEFIDKYPCDECMEVWTQLMQK